MKNNNLTEAERWLKQAVNDLACARHDAKGGFYAHTCFMSQQAGEKALKAFLYNRGERNLVSHALLGLLRKCIQYESSFEGLEKAVKKLDKYYIITRYPNGLPGFVPAEYFDEEEATEAIGLAEKILELTEEKVEKSRQQESES